jgi:hypothetical protein
MLVPTSGICELSVRACKSTAHRLGRRERARVIDRCGGQRRARYANDALRPIVQYVVTTTTRALSVCSPRVLLAVLCVRGLTVRIERSMDEIFALTFSFMAVSLLRSQENYAAELARFARVIAMSLG